MTDPRSSSFARLRSLAEREGGRRIVPLFAADPHRATRFSATPDDLVLDFYKPAIDDAALDALFGLADTAGLDDFRRRMFAGAMVNPTEHRAAMRMALRAALAGVAKDALGPLAATEASIPGAQRLAVGGTVSVQRGWAGCRRSRRSASGRSIRSDSAIGSAGGIRSGRQSGGAGLPLGHRQFRPMGRRAGQGPGGWTPGAPGGAHDGSANALISRFRALRGES
jgi:hypothetical protein